MKKISISLDAIEPFFQKIGELTKLQRILICSATVVVILGIFIWLLYYPKFEEISKLGEDIKKAEEKLADTKRQAAAYASYKKQMEEAQAQFELVARALPNREEIPSLLTSISQAGKASGLKFVLFQPQPEAVKDFYAEIPVKMDLTGSYHDLGVFFDKLAQLNRIVNVQNFDMSNGSESLTIGCNAVTYKFIDKPKAKEEPQKGKKKRRR